MNPTVRMEPRLMETSRPTVHIAMLGSASPLVVATRTAREPSHWPTLPMMRASDCASLRRSWLVNSPPWLRSTNICHEPPLCDDATQAEVKVGFGAMVDRELKRDHPKRYVFC